MTMFGEYVKLPLMSETVTICTETLSDEPDEPQELPEPDIEGGPPPIEGGAHVATAFVEQTDSVTVVVIIVVSVTETVSTCVFWFQPVL